MTNTVQNRRRIAGTGSPNDSAGKAGELALAFPLAAGANTDVEIWAHDGTKWVRGNKPVTVTTQSIDLGSVGGDVGAGYTQWATNAANRITGSVCIAVWGTPKQAYVLTNPGAPGAAGSWTSLGGAVSFASTSEIHTGTDTTKAINSAILRGETRDVRGTTAASDAGYIVRLNSAGFIEPKFLNITGIQFKGNVDPKVAVPAGAVAGDTYYALFTAPAKSGTAEASWGVTGTINNGDRLTFDGTKWHVLASTADLAAYVPLAGTAHMGGGITWDVATLSALTVQLNGGDATKSSIDNFTVDAGVF